MLRLEDEQRLRGVSGEQLMQELGGLPYDDAQRQAFIELVHVAIQDELINAEMHRQAGMPDPRPNEYRYLANLGGFSLRSKGRDRATGREIVVGFPDPEDDDGRTIPRRLVVDLAAAMGASLAVEETPAFLVDAGVPAEACPAIDGVEEPGAYIAGVLVDLASRSAPGRRVVREVIGRWLDDDLDLGPTDQELAAFRSRFARGGWHVANGMLVAGDKVKPTRRPGGEESTSPELVPDPERVRKVMVVYGRNSAVSTAMFDFLRALKLDPQEWGTLVRETDNAAPYTGEVLDRALEIVQAVVVLFTADDEARLSESLISDGDGPEEREVRGQPRPNVLYEAGLAMGRHPRRTILVEHGELRGLSDLLGRHTIRLGGNDADRLNDLAQRLMTAGCAVDLSGSQWLDTQRFRSATGPGS